MKAATSGTRLREPCRHDGFSGWHLLRNRKQGIQQIFPLNIEELTWHKVVQSGPCKALPSTWSDSATAIGPYREAGRPFRKVAKR